MTISQRWKATLTLSLALAGGSGATGPLRSAEPGLVLDIDPRGEAEATGQSSAVSRLATANGRTYFAVDPQSRAAPRGLWVSDGTASGTLSLGFEGLAEEDRGATRAATAGRLTYLLVERLSSEGFPLEELWRTDGTVPGTFRLVETNSGTDYPGRVLTPFGRRMVFPRCGELGCEPWITDGTVAGTRLLRDLTPGRSGSEPRAGVVFQGGLYFMARSPEGFVLWRTDGSTAGTRRIAGLPPDVEPGDFTVAGDRLYFSATRLGGLRRAALWVSDGTAAGTRVLPPFGAVRPRGASFFRPVGSFEGAFYFEGWSPGAGYQLWRTRGTPGETRPILDLGKPPGAVGDLVALGGGALFLGPGETLWSTRGTRATTRSASCGPRCPAQFQPLNGADAPLRVGGHVVLAGQDPAGGREPWVSDGTEAGTRQLADLCPGPCDSFPTLFGSTPDRIYLLSSAGDLWTSDGTPAGTVLLLPGKAGVKIASLGTLSSGGAPAFGPGRSGLDGKAGEEDVLVFAHYDPAFGAEIWRSDGTPEGTRRVRRLANGASSEVAALTPLGGGVVFSACNASDGVLWSSHGQAADTAPFFFSPNCYYADPGFLTRGGAAFFIGSIVDDAGGVDSEIWSTDGTPGGTLPLTARSDERFPQLISADFQGELLELRTGELGSIPQLWKVDPETGLSTLLAESETGRIHAASATAGRAYFLLEDAGSFPSLWEAGGPSGPVRLAEVSPRWDGALPLEPTRIGGVTFLLLQDFGYAEVWRTDGTPAGTHSFLTNPDAPAQAGVPFRLAELRGSLLLLGDSSDSDRSKVSLVRSDGTEAGSRVLKVFDQGRDLSTAPLGVELGDFFYFSAATPELGQELWRTDGTVAGTTIVRDIAPGPTGSKIQALTATGGRLAFSADDGVHGAEPWISDGTPEGTRMAGDVAPGELSSSPSSLAAAGGILYFSADDGVHGRELWKVALDPAGAAASLQLVAPRRNR